MTAKIDETIYQRPVELLQQLIRFDTSNPPGNERECVLYIRDLLAANGIESELFSKDDKRPNLVARLKGEDKELAPLMLYGHVDVVPSGNAADWTHPPFWGEIVDGFVWGRGTLDMKGAVSMMVSAFIKAKTEGISLPGDVVLCILSDEEVLGELGAHYMVEQHKELFAGVRYAIGEFGGFTLYVGGKKFYPIEIAQKQKCIIRATVKGPSGHGSSYHTNGTMMELARMLEKLDKNLLPVHITTAVEKMFTAMAAALPFPKNKIMRQLLNPKRTDFILKRVLGKSGTVFVPMFHNTVNATIIRTSNGVNVIPSEIEVEMDVRLLPGSTPQEVMNELRAVIGEEIHLEVLLYDPCPAEPEMGLFDLLKEILQKHDPEGIPVPLLLTGSTDSRFFSRLGIQTYGFIPMQLPEEMNFSRTIHSVDERIPVKTVQFGSDAIFKVMQRFHA